MIFKLNGFGIRHFHGGKGVDRREGGRGGTCNHICIGRGGERKLAILRKKYDRGGSGCAQDTIKIDRSGGSDHINGDESASAQDNKGIAQDGRGSVQEV